MQPIGLHDPERQPGELLRRDRAGRLPPRPPRPGHRRHQRPAAAGPAVLLPRHPDHPAGRPELHASSRSTARTRRSTTCCATACTRRPCTGASAPYQPNSLDGGCPFLAGADLGAFIDVPVELAAGGQGAEVARRPSTTTSARRGCSCRSMTPVEQDHVIQAYTFELGKCYEEAIRERAAAGAGQHRRRPLRRGGARAWACRRPQAESTRWTTPPRARRCPSWAGRGRWPAVWSASSPTRTATWTPSGPRRTALDAAGIVPLVIAPSGGFLGGTDGGIPVQRTYLTARSTEFDAVLVAGSGAPAPDAVPGRDAKAGEPGRRWIRASCCCFRRCSGTPRQSAAGVRPPRAWTAQASRRTPPGVALVTARRRCCAAHGPARGAPGLGAFPGVRGLIPNRMRALFRAGR